MKKVMLTLSVLLLPCGMVGMDQKPRYVRIDKKDSFDQNVTAKLQAVQKSNPQAFAAASNHSRYIKEEAAMNNLLNDTKNGACCVIS